MDYLVMKERLTLEKAEKIAKESFRKIKNKENREYHLLHSALVKKTVSILSKYFDVDKKVLEIAALVHDIGYVIDPENHAEESLKILERKFKVGKVLKDCILNHGFNKKPITLEGKIFQLADKLYILNPKLVSYLLKYKNTLKKEDFKFLRRIFDKALILFQKF